MYKFCYGDGLNHQLLNCRKKMWGPGGVSKSVDSTTILPNSGQNLQSTSGKISSWSSHSEVVGIGMLVCYPPTHQAKIS